MIHINELFNNFLVIKIATKKNIHIYIYILIYYNFNN